MGKGGRRNAPTKGPRCEGANRLPSKPSEGEDGSRVRKEAELSFEVGRAGGLLHGGRAIARGGAADGRRKVQVPVPQSVTAVLRRRLVRVPDRVERPDQKGRGTISGEYSSRPIRAVGRGSEADHDQAGVRVAEPRHPPSPVLLVPELPLSLPGDRGAVPYQARTAHASDYLLSYALERVLHARRNRVRVKALALFQSPPMLTPRDLRV